MPSLPEAVESKYGNSCFNVQIIDVSCISLSLRGCGRFRPPSVLILADCGIEKAGDENDLRQQCEGVTELDLSRNKFKAWEEVFKILQFVPSLTFLNLSYNNFVDSCSNSSCNRFNQLGKLVLNGTGLAWNDVYSLLALAPRLEELHLCLNGYVKVDKSSSCYKGIRRLHINCNPIHEWKQIEILGSFFPALEILILADCPIESLNADCQYEKLFPCLKYLSLNNSKIVSWDSIDLINKFPLLLELRLYQCPLFEQYRDEDRRNLTIARLEFIQRLNGGANITPDEKENAERAFIRYYMNFSRDQLSQRYFDLVSRHGHLYPLVNVSLKPKTMVHVTIKHENICLQKTLSVYMKVVDLKKMIAPELGISCSHMRVFYVDKASGTAYTPEELKINNKQLYTLNVNSGDEFIIIIKRIFKDDSNISTPTKKPVCHKEGEVKKSVEGTAAPSQASSQKSSKDQISEERTLPIPASKSPGGPHSPKYFRQNSKPLQKTVIKSSPKKTLKEESATATKES